MHRYVEVVESCIGKEARDSDLKAAAKRLASSFLTDEKRRLRSI